MFEKLSPAPGDALLALIGAFRADKRPGKIDVGVGVYRDEAGRTPVMRAVRAAELRLTQTQDSKTYLGLLGDVAFNDAMLRLVFGDPFAARGIADGSLRAVQTAGGCGALRVLADMVQRGAPGSSIWISQPTWLNHRVIFEAAGMKIREYRYLDARSGAVDEAGMLADLREARAGDLLLIHGCCHNPSGADLDTKQWDRLAELCERQGLLPFIDFAYMGLGNGLEHDAEGMRALVARVPEALIAVSCSKNFGLYRDRVGCAMVHAKDPAKAGLALDHMLVAQRGSYSMPPDHGAAAVRIILDDAALREEWMQELAQMRDRLNGLRQALADRFRERSGDARFDAIARQRGMFSLLGLSSGQVDALREKHAIYMPGDSRTNIAGLTTGQIPAFVDAVLAVR